MQRPLTLKDAAWFFVPLLLWGQLMAITHSAIHAGLARLPGPTVALAAFNVAIALHATLSASVMAMTQVGISYLSDRRSLHRLFGFGSLIITFNIAVSWLVALTPVGDVLYGTLFGASPAVTAQARQASFVMGLIFPIQLSRNLFISLLMQQRRTYWISIGTALRLAALAGFLIGLRPYVQGAPLGAIALTLCMALETLVIGAAVAPYYLQRPAREGTPPGYGELWRFAWPVMVNTLTENSVFFVVNLFLGRLARPDLALAGFGVVRGLAMMLLMPLRNLSQTAQALVRTRADLRVQMRFTLVTVGAGTGLIVVLFFTPLRGWVLETVLGLEPRLAAYCAAATLLFAVLAPAWSYAATWRGLLAGVRLTGALASSGMLRLVVVVGVGALALVWRDLNGAVLGAAAMTGAFLIEAAVLGRNLRGHMAAGRAYPAQPPEPPQRAEAAPGSGDDTAGAAVTRR